MTRESRSSSSPPIGILVGFLALLACACTTATQVGGPDKRAKEFLSNVYTGKQMDPEEWLSRETRTAPLFAAFGGLPRMVQQSTAWAESFGGLKSIDVREARVEGQHALVKVEVHFVRDHKTVDNKAVATNEDIVWDLRLIQEDGVWRVAP